MGGKNYCNFLVKGLRYAKVTCPCIASQYNGTVQRKVGNTFHFNVRVCNANINRYNDYQIHWDEKIIILKDKLLY